MLESIFQFAVLVVSAFAAGLVNTVAGGGTLLTFPALLRFGRLGRSGCQLHEHGGADARFRGRCLGLSQRVGADRPVDGAVGRPEPGRRPGRLAAGDTPAAGILRRRRTVAAADGVAVVHGAARRCAGAVPPRGDGQLPTWHACTAVVVFQFLVAVYGGYFGAGIGILMITSLGLMGLGDIHRINAVKTILAAIINGASVVVFVIDQAGELEVRPADGVGAIVGGYVGAVVGRRLPKLLVRWFVITVGLSLATYYFARQGGWVT